MARKKAVTQASTEALEPRVYELGVHRTEVICAKCKSHLGHIFDDQEAKTGKHYCINSVCLDLKPEEK